MTEAERLNAEFAELGEDEVARRLDSHHYGGNARVYAMRWLNEQAMERSTNITARAARASGAQAHQTTLIRRAENAATFAAAGAAIAAVASVVSAGVALKVLNTAEATAAGQQQLLQAQVVPPKGQLAEADPPGEVRRHHHPRAQALAR